MAAATVGDRVFGGWSGVSTRCGGRAGEGVGGAAGWSGEQKPIVLPPAGVRVVLCVGGVVMSRAMRKYTAVVRGGCTGSGKHNGIWQWHPLGTGCVCLRLGGVRAVWVVRASV